MSQKVCSSLSFFLPCQLKVLCFECTEEIKYNEKHPILTVGVKVMIGLDKTTKLTHVFTRYVDFCNEHGTAKDPASNKSLLASRLRLSDIEFIHCAVLNDNDTAESSALMKNDHIKVVNIRKDERKDLEEDKRTQREMDKNYFAQMRNLMPDFPSSFDILLDCRGKTVGADGLNQEVLRTSVRAHSAILRKRCKWLGGIIQAASDKIERQSIVIIPDHDLQVESKGKEHGKRLRIEDDDGVKPMLNYENNHINHHEQSGAAQIENDDEEDSCSIAETSRSGSPVFSSSTDNSSLLYVIIPNHPPEAVKILLEYCYTNRTISLGREAFEVACKPMTGEENAPVPPILQKWSDGGKPKVSFFVALSGISIAEEARIPRLSLMCEMAATILLDTTHDVVEALNLCTLQEKLTGNPLTKLRKAAMSMMLQRGQRGVTDMYRTPTFRRALDEKSDLLVPSLLHGTREHIEDEKKLDFTELTELKFLELDREDHFKRELERRKYRRGQVNDPDVHEDDTTRAKILVDRDSPPQNKRSKRNRSSYFRYQAGYAKVTRNTRRKSLGASFV